MDETARRRSLIPEWNPALLRSLAEGPGLGPAAVMLATRGVPVFPCTPGGKRPLTPHGFHDASAELAAVQGWWRVWPNANIGVPTGAVTGIDVVDVDVHPGGNGFAAFERARSAGLTGGWAWLVRTPSCGVHAYYLRNPRVSQRSWQLPSQHVDFRGDGGYIVTSPSRVATVHGQIRWYKLIAVAGHQATPVDAAGLRAFLEPRRPTRPPAEMTPMGARPDKLAAWVAERPEGARNQGLFWAACRLGEDGHPLESTVCLLGEAAQAAGLSHQEATATIRSAYRTASRRGGATFARPAIGAEVVAL